MTPFSEQTASLVFHTYFFLKMHTQYASELFSTEAGLACLKSFVCEVLPRWC